MACCKCPDAGIDTSTFTRPRKSHRQNAASKPCADNLSDVISTEVRQTDGQLEQPVDESTSCNSFEVNSRTFTRSSLRSRKSLLAAEAVEFRSSSSSVASDADERVRCNGGESMVDCAADTYWPCDGGIRDHTSCMHDDQLPNMVDIHIVAKAKLQEKGQHRCLHLFYRTCEIVLI